MALKRTLLVSKIYVEIFFLKIKHYFNKNKSLPISLSYKLSSIKLLKNKYSYKKTQDYKIYYINRNKDIERKSKFLKKVRLHGVEVNRIEAVDFKEKNFSLKSAIHLIGDRFYNSETFPLGSICCFLSHRKIWSEMIDNNISWALIFEDDATILGPLPKITSDFNLPKDAEIIFANGRMAEPILEPKNFHNTSNLMFNYYSLYNVFSERFRRRMGFEVVGAEAYFLSIKGAMKLLKAYDEIGYWYNNDLFMLNHSLSKSERISIDLLAKRQIFNDRT